MSETAQEWYQRVYGCDAPEDERREIVRCEKCSLNQFKTEIGRCRRCGQQFEIPAASFATPIPENAAPRQKCTAEVERCCYRLPHVLEAMRHSREMSQSDLAREIGVRRSYISKLENGKAQPTVKSLERICGALRFRVGFVVQVCAELAQQ